MTDQLKEIGFYTLEDNRAQNACVFSPLWRCELILTHRCNFNCPYCRGMQKEDQRDLTWDEARSVVRMWAQAGLKNIRFSGGEPTLWKDLPALVKFAKWAGIERIAVSTNGSADFSLYHTLYDMGVNDFSISLDGCCSSTAKIMNGGKDTWEKVKKNIQDLSKLTYVTVGVVLTDQNIGETSSIAKFASEELGVADIRLITAAQENDSLKDLQIPKKVLLSHPILNYRVKNFMGGRHVRGISQKDTFLCPLVLDDMAIMNGKHFPCIIYMREHGAPIGEVQDFDIKRIRKERLEWFQNHNCYKDKICQKNCLDVCIDYNNRWVHYHETFVNIYFNKWCEIQKG